MISFDKAYGALLGVFVGDAAGATLEFHRGKITSDMAKTAMHMPGGGMLAVAPGQVTDDSELALSLAHALSGINPLYGLPLEKMASNYAAWMLSKPFDVGNTCRQAFAIMEKDMRYPGMGKVPIHSYMMQKASDANEPMESNGSLMRIMPMAIWSAGQPLRTVAHNARMDAMLSHPNRVCQDCNALYCIAVTHLLENPDDAEGAVNAVEEFIKEHHVHPTVVDWLEKSVNITTIDCTTCIGHVKYAFILAFYFLRHKISFGEAIHDTLMKGGDTDTNAAIVGGIMGALHGAVAIPRYMSEPVEQFDCTSSFDTGYVRDIRFSTKMTKEVVTNLIWKH